MAINNAKPMNPISGVVPQIEAQHRGYVALVTVINVLGNISPPMWVTAEWLVDLANSKLLMTVNGRMFSYGVGDGL